MEDDIKEMVDEAKKAFEGAQYWPQEKVDEVVQAVGWMWQREEVRKVLARTAVDESGIGVYEDKLAEVKKQGRGHPLGPARDKDLRPGRGRQGPRHPQIRQADPASWPTWCPARIRSRPSAVSGCAALKTRNAMIVSPQPGTQKSSYLTVEYGRKALKKIGAPVDLLQCVLDASQEKTQQLMSHCDFAVRGDRWRGPGQGCL